jgi:hypothetical protein
MWFENAEHLVYAITGSETFVAHLQTGLQDINSSVQFGGLIRSLFS